LYDLSELQSDLIIWKPRPVLAPVTKTTSWEFIMVNVRLWNFDMNLLRQASSLLIYHRSRSCTGKVRVQYRTATRELLACSKVKSESPHLFRVTCFLVRLARDLANLIFLSWYDCDAPSWTNTMVGLVVPDGSLELKYSSFKATVLWPARLKFRI
jgi:hypothetical protein